MRKHAKQTRKAAKRLRRFSMKTVIIATAILAIGAVAIGAVAIGSRPKPEVKRASNPERSAPVANKASKNFVTVKVAGQDVQVDGQTGQIKELTPEEARKLASGLKQLVHKSVADRDVVKHADGSESIDMEGRFQSVAVAKINEKGKLVQACLDSPKAVAAFFGIDPKLMETTPEDRNQPTRVSPERPQN